MKSKSRENKICMGITEKILPALIIVIIISNIFSCRKEQEKVNGIYLEFEDSTHAVTYYKVCLNEQHLVFSHIIPTNDRNCFSGFSIVHSYEKTFSYDVKGDNISKTEFSIIYYPNVYSYPDPYAFKYEKRYGKFQILKDKLILNEMKYYYIKNFYPFFNYEFSDTTYSTRVFYKVKGMKNHCRIH